jgi:polyisoprenyl-phosphate glycosyltransferase
MNLIIIPVYNDWKSLNKLLDKINKNLDRDSLSKILIIDDFSSIKMDIKKKKFNKIKKIEVLRLNENVGSQKAIAAGLHFLNNIKKKKDFDYVTIMDGDGEDNPKAIKNMIQLAKKQKNYVIVSCRKDRNENLIIKYLYKIHLTLTFFLTGNWISFGNFSCFYHKNLKKILSDNSIWHAYSAAIMKNTAIKRVYGTRPKRFYGSSQVRLLFLVAHSIRIIGVFYKRVLSVSLFSLFLIKIFVQQYSLIFYSIIFLLNVLILLVMHDSKVKPNYSFSLKNITK